MNPQTKYDLDGERTEEQPAQERLAVSGESGLQLSAEQIYAQRLAESSLNGDVPGAVFIP